MPSFNVLALLGFLISWPIASTTDQSYNIIGDVSHGYDLTIEDKDIDYDLLSEDYLDYDRSNETERETRELRSTQAYEDVTESSTGNYTQGYILYISYQ